MVSVILPIFGEFRADMLRTCLESLQLQQGIRIEVTVACPEGDSRVQCLAAQFDCQCAPVPSSLASRDGAFIPGVFRNMAASQARGDYLFNADIDVLYTSKTFFSDLVALAAEKQLTVLYWPPMRRMPLDSVPMFLDMATTEQLPALLAELDLRTPFFACLPGTPRLATVVFRNNTRTGWIARQEQSYCSVSEDGTSVGPDERILVYLADDLALYRSSSDNKGKEPLFCTQDIHCGSTLVEMHAFKSVGGFCMDYSAWGSHDADLQWKLRHSHACGTIPRQERFAVLHLDHPRGHFNYTKWVANRALLADRKAHPDAAIDRDRISYSQLF